MERTVPVPFSHRSPSCSSSPAQRLGLASELPRRIGQDELHGGLLRQGPKLALGGCGVRSGNNTTRHPHVAWGYKHFGKITPQNHLICCNQVAHLAHQALAELEVFHPRAAQLWAGPFPNTTHGTASPPCIRVAPRRSPLPVPWVVCQRGQLVNDAFLVSNFLAVVSRNAMS